MKLKKFKQKLELEIYQDKKNFFKFVNYDEMIETYEHVVNGLKNNNWLI